jgi:hypothetical protein
LSRSNVARAWLWSGVVATLAGAARAAAPIPVQHTGPDDNRVKIFFLGDGYTASQIDTTYVQHVQEMVDHLFHDGQDPYPRYQNFFNVYRVNVVSQESGADVPPLGISRNTALDASYFYDGVLDRLLYVNETKANNALNSSLQGTGLVADIRFVAVNDTRYGGGGGRYAAYAGGNPISTEIALHESGHSFDGLADEYGGEASTYAGREPFESNVTTDPSGAKWSPWLGYDQPGIGVIGAYEGARYYDHGLYRPSLDSKMRTLGMPFDAIARQAIILDIYSHVTPVDDYLPNDSAVNDPNAFFVDVIDPAVINVQWLLDGSPIAGAAGETPHLGNYRLSAGTHTLSARAYDPTDWVRVDRDLLEQTVSWTLSLIPGDANGDALVTVDDYTLIDRGMALGLTGWSNGDFDGDGVITSADYLQIDCAFAGGVVSPSLLAQREAQFGPEYVSQLVGMVPEPSLLGIAAVWRILSPRRR